MENTYFSKDLGGYFEENYMPDLAELSKEGISFSHKEKGLFGGAFRTSGSGWSVAAMVNMNTGLPMKVPVDGNSYGQPGNFLPGATCLGDILKEQGYEQSVMFGADAADIRTVSDYKVKKAQSCKVNNVLAPTQPINELSLQE